ncbi:MAG: two-component system phosphate regulon sensor histidine kinase PhoR, partial [Pseudohongiellaceae bacterium]
MIFKSQYFWRTYLGYVLVALIGTFLFALSLLGRIDQQAQERMESSLAVTAQLLSVAIAPALQNLNYPLVRDTVSSIAETSNLRITVIDGNGLVIADSHENPFTMNNHLRRPEVQLAATDGMGRAERYSFTLEENFDYLALPLYSSDSISGFVRVAKASSAINAEIRQSQSLLLRNSAITTFFIVLLAFYLATRQASKVAELTVVAEEISSGDFSRRIPVGKALGLEKLSEAINRMARSSASRVSEITADRNRLATVFTCMVEGVIDVDMKQNILHINDAAARMLSINANNCIGKPLWMEIRSQEIIDALDEAIKTFSVIKVQMRMNQDLGQRVVDIYAASLSDDRGVAIGAVLVLHDITELKNLERIRTDFVANASHELKTPITAIRGLSETILADDQVERGTILHFTDRIHAQSLRLSQLVGDLMTISRLEGGHNNEDFSKVNFTKLVRQAVRAAQATAEEKGHTIDAQLPVG